jgi:hypothetical protein
VTPEAAQPGADLALDTRSDKADSKMTLPEAEVTLTQLRNVRDPAQRCEAGGRQQRRAEARAAGLLERAPG